MTPSETLTTAEQLLALPRDGMRRELISGRIRNMTPSGELHGRVTMRFAWPLGKYVDENHLGAVYAADTGFLIKRNPDTVRAPDAAFVARERMSAAAESRSYFPGAPDLAVEVISPSDSYSDVDSKVTQWLDAGCRMVVVVDARHETILVRRVGVSDLILDRDATFDGDDVVPGFRLAVRRLFTFD